MTFVKCMTLFIERSFVDEFDKQKIHADVYFVCLRNRSVTLRAKFTSLENALWECFG